MNKSIITVKNLSKKYRIGKLEEKHDSIFLKIINFIISPINNFVKLRNLTSVKIDDDSADITWALKNISLNVEHGDVVGIIGGNGAGKSTLLKLLSKITSPTAGQIQINGRVASLLEVGTGFHPELSGRENIYLNGSILGMSKVEIESKFSKIVDFSGVEKFIDTPIKRYSSGMKVRLAFSVAAHLDPEILLIDEVLAVGDAEFQKLCLNKMDSISKEGRTILFVSHNLNSIEKLCNKCILLKDGEIIKTGHTRDVLKAYNEDLYNDDKIFKSIKARVF